MSENGPIGLNMVQNLGIDIKINSLGCSEPKLQIWTFYLLSGQNGHKWHFGHSGQSEVSGNGTIGFPMYKNIVIDTKIKAQACSKPNLQIWTF